VLAVATAALARRCAGGVCLPTRTTPCVYAAMRAGVPLLSALPGAGDRAGMGNASAGLPILAAPLQRLVLLGALRLVTHGAPAVPKGQQAPEEQETSPEAQEMLAYLDALRQAAGAGDVAGSAASAAERRAALGSARHLEGLEGGLVLAGEEVEVLQRWTEQLTDAFRYYPVRHTACTPHGPAAAPHVAAPSSSSWQPEMHARSARLSLDVSDLLPPGLTIVQRQGGQAGGEGARGHGHGQMSTRVRYLSLSSKCSMAQLLCPPVSTPNLSVHRHPFVYPPVSICVSICVSPCSLCQGARRLEASGMRASEDASCVRFSKPGAAVGARTARVKADGARHVQGRVSLSTCRGRARRQRVGLHCPPAAALPCCAVRALLVISAACVLAQRQRGCVLHSSTPLLQIASPLRTRKMQKKRKAERDGSQHVVRLPLRAAFATNS